ncbi:MAG: YdcF family protein [Bryobacteraceae bacterium]
MSPGVQAFRIRPRFALLLSCLLSIAVAWCFREPLLKRAGMYLDVGQPPQKADAVLVLAGGRSGERILKAGELVRGGYAPVAYVSGPRTFYDMSECAASIPFAERHGYPAANFRCIENDELSTATEAQACCAALRRAGVRKFLLVTTAFHTRRAARLYREFCPQLEFVTVSAESPLFENRYWFRVREARKTIFEEYLKLLATPFRL